MGTETESVADALFTRTQQRVLGLLFGQPERKFGTLELIELTGAGRGAVQRELERLARSGLITRESQLNLRRYQANHDAVVFEELRSIVEKLAGVPDVLRRALSLLEPRIALAILYGSVAKHRDRATSDIDVLVVGDGIALDELYEALEPAERRLGRPVSPTLYSVDEFDRRRRARQAFVTRVLENEHVVLLGSESVASKPR